MITSAVPTDATVARASRPLLLAAVAAFAVLLPAGPAAAQSTYTQTQPALGYAAGPLAGPFSADDPAVVEPDDGAPSAEDEDSVLPDRFRKTVVAYNTNQPPGTIVIDTANTYLYYVLGGGRAIRYGVGVGREGFTWAGTQAISRKAEWPDWHPPAQMIARQPYLPRFMAGGPGNPLGARAMYLGATEYRIHGTNDPTTIGKFVSSGCIRLTNEDVSDLFSRVDVGTRVVVLPKFSRGLEARRAAPGRQAMNVPAPSAD